MVRRLPNMDRLHVVIIDEELPYPLTSGKRIRSANLVTRLARRHRVTYVCHRNSSANEAAAAREYFEDRGIATIVVDRRVPPQRGLGFYWRLAANLLSPLPYSVASHTSRELNQTVADLAARERVDLWQCEWTPYAAAMRGLPGARWVVMAHNVESLIWQRYYETEQHPLRRWYIEKQWRKFAAFERAAFAAASCTIAVSDADAELAERDFGAQQVAVVDNGVDTQFFTPGDGPREAERLLFLGSLDWRPNQDGVRHFLERVFPLVRQGAPRCELDIVGRNPPPWLTALVAATPGARLSANVTDVRPWLRSATLMVTPLRIGGGSRLKILESLACELPVVSTTVGCEGLELEAGRHLAVADAPEDFASCVLARIRDRSGSAQQARAGREVVLQRYDWDALADRLDEVWRTYAGATSAQLVGAA